MTRMPTQRGSNASPQDQQINRLIREDTTRLYRKWFRAVERYFSGSPEEHERARIENVIRHFAATAGHEPAVQPPPISMSVVVSGNADDAAEPRSRTPITTASPKTESTEKRWAREAAARHDLTEIQNWVESANETATGLFLGVRGVTAVLEGAAAWKQCPGSDWTVTDTIDACQATARLFFEGVYGQWDAGWVRLDPEDDSLRCAADQLKSALERALGFPKRLVVMAVTSYDPEKHRLETDDLPNGKVVPLTFRVESAPPDLHSRKALMRPLPRVPRRGGEAP